MKKLRSNKHRKGILGLFATLAFALGVGVARIPKHVLITNANTTFTDSIQKANSTNGGTSAIADGTILVEGNGSTNIARTGSRTATIITKYNTNSATTHSIFNNSAGEIRLYPRNGNGGGLSFEISTGYYFTEISITATGTTGAISINGGDSTDITTTVKTVSQSFSNQPTTISFKNSKDATSSQNLQVKTILVSYESDGSGGEPEPDPDPSSIIVSAAGGATTLKVSSTLQMSAVVEPNGSDPTVEWSSSDETKAIVDETTGLVKAISAGPVNIIATSTKKPSVTKSYALTIINPYTIFDAYELFENQTALTGSYLDGSFVGMSGATFTYGHSRNEDTYGIDSKGIILRRASDSFLQFTLPNGLSLLKFDYMKAYTGKEVRQLELQINGVVVETSDEFGGATGAEDTIYTFEYEPTTAYPGPVIIKIKNVGDSGDNRHITLDNIVWNDGPESNFGVLSSLTLNTESVITEYYNGDLLSLDGLIATAFDTEGNDKLVTGEVTSNPIVGYEFTVGDALVGTKSITITYSEGGKQASKSFTVTVLELVLPTNIVFNVSSEHSGTSDSTTYPVGSVEDKEKIIFGTMASNVDDMVVQLDGSDTAARVYKAAIGQTIAGIQPLKLGTGSNKGNFKLLFDEYDFAAITKVTLYARRDSASATNATLQVNNAPAQNIGVSGKADVKFAAYEFIGSFGNELIIRNNTNLAVYLYGMDIEYMDFEEEALAFANEVVSGSGLLAEGSCHAVLEGLEQLYDGLSLLAQEEFETSPAKVFKDARDRLDYLRAWTAVNEKPVEPDPEDRITLPKNDLDSMIATLIIGVIGLTTLAGYYFIQKKQRI